MAKNLIAEMKDRIKNSGANKKEIMYFAPDSVHRVRFLTELDAGSVVEMHNQFGSGNEDSIFSPCVDPEDHEDCPYCKEEVPTQEWYAWSVWDYDNNSVKLIFQKATGISPIPSLIEMYEEYGTILDRDYKIKKVGKGTTGSYTITPLDKSVFKSKKAKAYSEDKIKDIVSKAYGHSKEDDEDSEEEEKPKKISKKKKKKQEKNLRGKVSELDFSDLKSIALELGMTKKEIKSCEDEDELIDEIFDNFEENDIEDLYNDLMEDDEDE